MFVRLLSCGRDVTLHDVWSTNEGKLKSPFLISASLLPPLMCFAIVKHFSKSLKLFWNDATNFRVTYRTTFGIPALICFSNSRRRETAYRFIYRLDLKLAVIIQ